MLSFFIILFFIQNKFDVFPACQIKLWEPTGWPLSVFDRWLNFGDSLDRFLDIGNCFHIVLLSCWRFVHTVTSLPFWCSELYLEFKDIYLLSENLPLSRTFTVTSKPGSRKSVFYLLLEKIGVCWATSIETSQQHWKFIFIRTMKWKLIRN